MPKRRLLLSSRLISSASSSAPPLLSLHRVVVTGIGLVTPLGCGNRHVWDRLMQGDCGLSTIPSSLALPPSLPVHVAGFIERCNEPGKFHFVDKEAKHMADFTQFALYAADIALSQARFEGGVGVDLDRAGVSLSSAVGAIGDITAADKLITQQQSIKKLSLT